MRAVGTAWTVLAALVAAAAFACTPALASPLDRDFGSGGIARFDSPGDEQAHATLLQSDGRIVIGGTTDQTGPGRHFALTRFKPGGSPDRSFGTDGLVVTPFTGASGELLALAQQPDGKIVAVGSATNALTGDVDTAIVRYNADGSLDTPTDSTPATAFGLSGSGMEIIDLSGSGNRDFGKGVVVQPGGAIVVGYSVRVDTAGDYDFAATRLTPEGLPDPSFGSGGTQRLNIATAANRKDELEAMVRQPDGKLVLVGASTMSDGAVQDDAFSFARLNADGTVDDGGLSDTTPGDQFGADGTTTVQFTPLADHAFAAAVQPDGKIVAAGSADLGSAATGADFALTRLDPDGTVDPTFGGGDGEVTTSIAPTIAADSAVGLAIQADGKIAADGFSDDSDGFELARYTRAGKLDKTFDHDGKLVAPRSGAAAGLVALAGRLIATGGLPGTDGAPDFAAVRYLADDRDSDGVPDSEDNCEGVATRNVTDTDRDGRGDACDSNDDDDRLPDRRDHCPRAAAQTGNGCPATNHNDHLVGTASSDRICGLFGNDVIRGLGGDDSLGGDSCLSRAKRSARRHRDGNDRLYGGNGSDELSGGGGNDKLSAGSGRDVLTGGRGNDRLFGGSGSDRLVGGSGNDRLVGGRGRDSYSAGAGNDVVIARDHLWERIRCGSGRDRAIVDRNDLTVGCEHVRRR